MPLHFAVTHVPHHPTMLSCAAAHCAAAVEKLWVGAKKILLLFFFAALLHPLQATAFLFVGICS